MILEISILFLVIALIYSSVGFGGGSSYLAILILFGIDSEMIRIIALLCNIVVVSGGTYLYYKNGLLKWRKVIPLVALSIPLAFLGGALRIEERTFFLILAVALFLAAVLLWFKPRELKETHVLGNSTAVNTVLGGGLGFISGMVGIGGGIFLSPVLHFINWDKVKVISASASFFILVNSISGIAGQLQNVDLVQLDVRLIGFLLLAVLIGGQIGSRLSIKRLNPLWVRKITALLIAIVGIRTFFDWI